MYARIERSKAGRGRCIFARYECLRYRTNRVAKIAPMMNPTTVRMTFARIFQTLLAAGFFHKSIGLAASVLKGSITLRPVPADS